MSYRKKCIKNYLPIKNLSSQEYENYKTPQCLTGFRTLQTAPSVLPIQYSQITLIICLSNWKTLTTCIKALLKLGDLKI